MDEPDASAEAERRSVDIDSIFCVVRVGGTTYQVIPDWLILGGDNCEITKLFFAGEEILY